MVVSLCIHIYLLRYDYYWPAYA